jgi:hypothetical protein
MFYTVTVSFGPSSEFEFRFSDQEVLQLAREEASRWLRATFDALECAPRNPVGKILLLDVILDVAKYGGEDRFAKDAEWGQRFALCCAAVLDRDTIRVDVPNLVVG